MTINKILIAGGGTAGWMTAVNLAKAIGVNSKTSLQITLVESSDVPTVGVGEGTFPSIKTTLNNMGIGEAEFVKACDATFKQGIRFNNWAKNPDLHPEDYYQHLFDPSHQMRGQFSLAPYWAQGGNGEVSYSESVTLQHANCERALGPKVSGDQAYFGGFQYAYHLDAGKLASFLKSKAIALGVEHIVGTIESVQQSITGDITSVTLMNDKTIEADLFIDCTGFAALLIGKTLGEDVMPVDDTLFVDRAMTVQLPYSHDHAPIPSTTISTAHEAGWTWDIGLRHRRGIGYVYSSSHSSDERAAEVLRNYLQTTDDADFNIIPMKTGYRKQAWVKNCVAIGLSGGFLEPLEATGVIFIEAALRLLTQYFPRAGNMDVLARHFNEALDVRYQNAISFLKLHYCISQRKDNDFWTDNRVLSSIPESLQQKLTIWQHRFPHRFDFNLGHETFGVDSHSYVLLGMGFKPDIMSSLSAFPHKEMARRHFKLLRNATNEATSAMMSHRNLIEGVHNGSIDFV